MPALFGPLFLVTLCTLASACCPDSPRHADAISASSGAEAPQGQVLRGEASYYANSLAGNRTANGERYDPRKLTAASRSLPFGTRLQVRRVDNGKSVIVRVNDRGPF